MRGVGRGRLAGALVAVMLVGSFFVLEDAVWHPVREQLFDAYQRQSPRPVELIQAVVVEIDEPSLAEVGQWPWARHRLAELIEATAESGAAVIGLDLVMPEPDRLSLHRLAEREDLPQELRDRLAGIQSNDAVLARTLEQLPVVIARVGIGEEQDETRISSGASGGQTPVMIRGEGPYLHRLLSFSRHLTSLAQHDEAAWGRGYINSGEGPIVRRVPLVLSVGGETAPGFAVELLRVGYGENWYELDVGPSGLGGLWLGERFVPTAPDGALRLHYSEDVYEGRYVSALDVLARDVDLSGLVAIIGVTEASFDLVETPLDTRHGVGVHAEAVENILAAAAGQRLQRPSWAGTAELGVFVVLALLFVGAAPRLRVWLGAPLILLVVAGLLGASWLAFEESRWLLDPVFPALGQVILGVTMLAAGLAESNRRRRELARELVAERIERGRMEGELGAAREIQLGMLPATGAIAGLPDNIELSAVLEPATEVGGDLYDAVMLDAHRLFFLIGDVSGKGVSAALFMALSKALCKSVALRRPGSLGEMMSIATAEISRDNPGLLFLTAVAGILDSRDGTLELCNAGHEPPILLRGGKSAEAIDVDGGPPVCVLDDFRYASGSGALEPGDLLVLLTDGVTESRAPDGVLYGREHAMERLTALARDVADRDSAAQALCDGLLEDVHRHAAGEAPADDVTILALRYG